jgi:perosamine synthetase
MMIPVFEPVLGESELRNVIECVESGWISSGGDFIKRFEEGMASYCRRRFGIAVNNGTNGLIAAFRALDLPPGSEVIMPSFTIISCALAAVYNHLVPVFVDSDPMTWNMEAEQIRDAITKRTRAILVVHIYGLPVEMEAVGEIVNQRDLVLVEDHSEALGSMFQGAPCGSFGAISIASTYANKAVTTGEGGVCLTDDPVLAERLRDIGNLCFGKRNRFRHSGLGHNFRMTNLQAAVGAGQLERIDDIVARKIEIGESYSRSLKPLEDRGLLELRARLPERVNSYWMNGCVLTPAVSADASEVRARLAAKGIDTRAFFSPLHDQPPLEGLSVCGSTGFSVAERLATRGFYLPSGLALEQNTIEHIAQTLGDVINGL